MNIGNNTKPTIRHPSKIESLVCKKYKFIFNFFSGKICFSFCLETKWDQDKSKNLPFLDYFNHLSRKKNELKTRIKFCELPFSFSFPSFSSFVHHLHAFSENKNEMEW